MKMKCVRAAFTLIELPAVSQRKRVAFTLIELLVVIAIIGILAAILLPVMNAAFRRAENSQAQTEVRALESALRAYINEYHVNPTNMTGVDFFYDLTLGTESNSTGVEVEIKLIQMFRGENISGQNPRKIQFMEFADATIVSNKFVDPWGQPYKYMLDYDFSGVTHIEFTNKRGMTNLNCSVAVWSKGPDNSDEYATNRVDDVRSW